VKRAYALAAVLGVVALAVAEATPAVRAARTDGLITAGPFTQVSSDDWINGISADGRYLLGGAPEALRRLDTATGAVEAVPVTFSPNWARSYPARLSADGASAYVYTATGLTTDDDGTRANTHDLFRWDFASSSWTLLTGGSTVMPVADSLPTVSDDGSVVLIKGNRILGPANATWRLTVAGQVLERVDDGADSLGSWMSADGRFVAFTSDGHARLYDATTGTSSVVDVRSDGAPAGSGGNALGLSADGSKVVFSSAAADLAVTGPRGPNDRTFVRDRVTGTTVSIGPDVHGVWAISGDGERIAYRTLTPNGSQPTDWSVNLVDLRRGQPVTTEWVSRVDDRPLNATTASITRDGRRFYLGSAYSIVDGRTVSGTVTYVRPLRATSLPPAVPLPEPPAVPEGVVAAGPPENLLPGLRLLWASDDASMSWVGNNQSRLWLYDRVATRDVPGASSSWVLDTVAVPGGLLIPGRTALTPDDTDGDGSDVYRYDVATGTWAIVTNGGPFDPTLDWGIDAASADGSTFLLTAFNAGTLLSTAYTYAPATGVLTQILADVPPAEGSWIGLGPTHVDVSDDGRYVSFVSNGHSSCIRCQHVYVYDTVVRTYTIVDRNAQNRPAWGDAREARLSGDGRSVVFRSNAFDLDADAPPESGFGLYVHHLDTGVIRRISASGTTPSISGDGRRVAYIDNGTLWVNVERDDGGAVRQAMSVIDGGAPPGWVGHGVISTDGEEVLFGSTAILPGDPTDLYSVYRRPIVVDGGPPASTTTTSTTSTTSTTTPSSTTSTTTPSSTSSTTTPTSTSSTTSSTTTSSSTTEPAPTTTVAVEPPVPASPAPASPPFVAVVPARLLDTRPGTPTVDGDEQGAGASAPGQTTRLRIAGRGGVPIGASAVALNVTATGAEAAGYATVWPCSSPAPTASNLNVVPGQTVANLVLTGLDADGDVCIRTGDGRFHVIVDVVAATPAGGYQPVLPTRLLDTRIGARGSGPVPADEVVSLRVSGRAGVPGDATAVALNLTATGADDTGYVAVWPCGPRPLASSANLTRGATVANLVLVPVDANGDVCLQAMDAATELVVDVQGYVAPGAAFAAQAPVRLLDTRPGAATIDGAAVGHGLVAAGSVIEVPIAGRAGLPSAPPAVVVNVTATGGTGAGYVTVWGCGAAPEASSLNVAGASAVPNAAIVEVSGDGSICLRPAEASMQLIVDVIGAIG
jgi:hypothetical protein